MNFSEELIEKAKAAKTVEELIALAKAEKIELTSEQATDYFSKLNQKSGEISDEELDNVSGGACYVEDGRLIVTICNICMLYKCRACGSTYKSPHGSQCKKISMCANCAYAVSGEDYMLCNNKRNNFSR